MSWVAFGLVLLGGFVFVVAVGSFALNRLARRGQRDIEAASWKTRG